MEITDNAVNPKNGAGNGRRNRNQENQLQVACRQCSRRFHNSRGLIIHLRFCNPILVDEGVGRPPPLAAVNEDDNNRNGANDAVAEQQFFWGNRPRNQGIEKLKECNEKIVSWCKNLFMLPDGSSAKDYVKEITRLINKWLIRKSNREMCNVHLTYDASVIATEAIKVFQK